MSSLPKTNQLYNKLKIYMKEISLLDNDEKTLMIKDEVIIIPESKKKYILYLLRQGHYGLEKIMNNEKHKVWWPNMRK